MFKSFEMEEWDEKICAVKRAERPKKQRAHPRNGIIEVEAGGKLLTEKRTFEIVCGMVRAENDMTLSYYTRFLRRAW